MPRANSPFLTSISGSLRGGPTFRATSQTPDIVMQTRPVPTDRRTAKQAAVRDAYSRLAYLWKNLSHLDKEPYEIMAEARNLTPWNCWLSFHLPLMRLTPSFYVPFVEGAGTTVQNFALDGTAGTINGPVWTEKNNRPTLSFDGIDDKITFNAPATIDNGPSITILLLFTIDALPATSKYFLTTSNHSPATYGFGVYKDSAHRLYYSWGNGTSSENLYTTQPIPKNQLITASIVQTPSLVTLKAFGSTKTRANSPIALATSNDPITIFNGYNNWFPTKGKPYLFAVFPYAMPDPTLEALKTIYQPFFT